MNHILKLLDIRILLNSFLFIIVLYFTLQIKESFQEFDKRYLVLTKKSYNLRLEDHTIMDILKESLLNTKFNNDIFNIHLKKHEESLDNLIKLERTYLEYKKSFMYLLDHKKEFKNTKKNIYKFIRYNAKVNNSLLYLENEINNLNKYEKDFGLNLIKIVTKLSNNKLNFKADSELDNELFNYFNNYKTDITNYILIKTHIKLLYKQIPNLKKTFKTIEKSKEFLFVDLFENSLQKEAKLIQKKLDNRFIILLFLLVSLFILIIFLMFKIKIHDKKMLDIIKENEKKLKYDSLTDIYSKEALNQYLFLNNKNIGVLLIDISNFRKVNSIIGYDGGDYILKTIAQLLKKICKVYRFDSDKFVVISSQNELYNLGVEINNIIENYEFIYNGYDIPIQINIGATNKKPFIKNSELALFKCKNSNKNILIFDDNLDDSSLSEKNIQMLRKVKNALKEDCIVPFFQPIVSIKTKEVVKYESLVRLIDGDKVISPYFFLDITKGSTTYQNITETMITKSLEFIKKENIDVSINISFEDITNINTMNFIEKILNDNKDYASYITFELLESENIENFTIVKDFIKLAKDFKCKIAIDDFGTGYSNFEYLFKLEPDILKIDGSLIKDINTNFKSKTIVESIVYLAKKTNIKIVAEFVEDIHIERTLEELEIDYGQGYYYSPPKNILYK